MKGVSAHRPQVGRVFPATPTIPHSVGSRRPAVSRAAFMASSQESSIPASVAVNFLSIPLEIRLTIYEIYLSDHQRVLPNCQPSNAHICVLHTCRQIAYEARPLFSQFISFRYEQEITAFTAQTNDFSHVRWADVANDGRLAQTHDTGQVRLVQPHVSLYHA